MDSIKNGMGKLSGWVKSNITGDEQVTGKDYTPRDKRAREIQDRVELIRDRVDKIDKDISKIADTSELRPPKLSDVSDKELVIIGAGGGAVVGGALEMADGVLKTALDNPAIEVTKTEVDINRPVLKGYDDRLIEDKDSGGMLKGYDHKFTPRIEQEKVGDYTVKEGKVIHTTDADSPVIKGVKGMVTGGIIGGGVGLAVAVIRRVLKKGTYVPRKEERELEGQGKVIAGTAALGAAGGAAVAGLGGVIERGHYDSKDISFEKPIMEKTSIGQIPQDHYHSVYDVVREENIPKRDVTMDSPKMEKGLLGFGEKPEMEKVTKTVEVEPRFGVMGQVLGGAIVGGICGTLLGIVLNTLRRII